MTQEQPKEVDSLLFASWVIPVVPEGTTLEDHAVVIQDDCILDILASDQARRRYRPRVQFELDNQVLLPGLINLHGHAAMTLFRGLADDLPLMTWLNEHIWPAEGRHVSEEFVADGSALAIGEMLRGGTTFFSDMYFFPEVTAEVARQHRIRAQLCFPVIDFPTNWGSGPDDYLRKGLALYDRYRNSDWIQVAFGPHAPYTISDGPLVQVQTLADELDARIQIHLHETESEVADALRKTGLRPVQRLAELGLLGPNVQCVHMTQLDDHDIKLVEQHGAHVVHCPESNLKLASGFCPVEKLRRANINVALGTDGAASNNDLDLLGEIRTAALLAKAVSGDAAAINAHQALAMATINGARALGLEANLGSLEPGKWADIIAVDLSDAINQPVYDAVSHLVYSTNAHQVSHSWIGGHLQMEKGELKGMDLVGLRDRVRGWASRIRSAG